MPNRDKLLVHLRRISGLFENAFRNGPDGTLEGKYALEHPIFIHSSCGFYIAGCLAFLEGEDGAYSWNTEGVDGSDFDTFVANHPSSPKDSYHSRGINKVNLDALAEVRNAVIHNDCDLARNRNTNSAEMVKKANLPGVILSENVVTLEAEFLEYVRIATLAVRNFHGEF